MSSTDQLRFDRTPDSPGATPDHEQAWYGDRLEEVLRSELHLLGELQSALRTQRQGVADDDVETVDRSVHTMQRLILALAGAREQRRLLLDKLDVASDVPLGRLEVELGARLTESTRAVILELQAKAVILARDIEGNRQILVSALAENDAYARALFGEPLRGPVYDAGAREMTGKRHGGALLNQRI